MRSDLAEKIVIGTSGFYYAHWRGVLYPDTVSHR